MSRRLQLLPACLLAALLAGGCATPPEDPFEPPVYPPPPNEARFIYEMTVVSSAQVQEQGGESRLKELLTGVSSQRQGVGFSKPYDAVACGGTVYVSDSVSRVVYGLDFRENKFLEIGVEEPGSLRKPLGLAVDAACNLYVADFTNARVVVYDAEGEYLDALGGKQWFSRLSHVAVSADGSLVFAVDTGGVSDPAAHRIRVFDRATGDHLYDIGSRGTGDGQFNLPKDAEIGPDGQLYVVDSANFRIQVFEQDGTFLRTFGGIGSRSGQFSRPKGIALDPEGRVYVADAAFGNFQIFTPEGELLLFIGDRSETGGPGLYMLPAGIDVDEDGRVYFVDQFFRKVDVFRPAGLEPGLGSGGPVQAKN